MTLRIFFLKLIIKSVFRAMENVRKERDIKLIKANNRRNYLVSESNYHTTRWFSKFLLAIETKK